ncbi:MAG: hypothetical protein RSC06_04240 [Clostridia bacterium]
MHRFLTILVILCICLSWMPSAFAQNPPEGFLLLIDRGVGVAREDDKALKDALRLLAGLILEVDKANIAVLAVDMNTPSAPAEPNATPEPEADPTPAEGTDEKTLEAEAPVKQAEPSASSALDPLFVAGDQAAFDEALSAQLSLSAEETLWGQRALDYAAGQNMRVILIGPGTSTPKDQAMDVYPTDAKDEPSGLVLRFMELFLKQRGLVKEEIPGEEPDKNWTKFTLADVDRARESWLLILPGAQTEIEQDGEWHNQENLSADGFGLDKLPSEAGQPIRLRVRNNGAKRTSARIYRIFPDRFRFEVGETPATLNKQKRLPLSIKTYQGALPMTDPNLTIHVQMPGGESMDNLPQLEWQAAGVASTTLNLGEEGDFTIQITGSDGEAQTITVHATNEPVRYDQNRWNVMKGGVQLTYSGIWGTSQNAMKSIDLDGLFFDPDDKVIYTITKLIDKGAVDVDEDVLEKDLRLTFTARGVGYEIFELRCTSYDKSSQTLALMVYVGSDTAAVIRMLAVALTLLLVAHIGFLLIRRNLNKRYKRHTANNNLKTS